MREKRKRNAILLLAFRFYFLCLLARCSRYLAFWRADPLPCAPVMYFFFLALVLHLARAFVVVAFRLAEHYSATGYYVVDVCHINKR